ncbi:MAG TPA: DUF1800 domain-containing protein [Humisphaera sp.]|jgi:uncharacterized protein (DUF1800 family)|nr:DUF1800 domain-containing protein [Humisphaera sp.]
MIESDSNPPANPWARYRPSDAAPWDLRRVVHLHRRAGFAAAWREIQRDLRDGPDAAIDRLLAGNSRIDGIPQHFDELAARIGDAAVVANDADRLKAWWLYRMLFSPDVLRERLVLMWHGHFATSQFKVRDLAAMRAQNERFRSLAMAPFGKLLREMLHDTALLVWLDAPSNRKGHANENLGRELMELFTLGIGNYSEQDVKEAARALTGCSVADDTYRFRPEWHDEEEKMILGQSGNFNADDLAGILLAQPATSTRLAQLLCKTFMGENVVDEAAMNSLATGLREHDLDIHWAIETLLRSELFFSDANIATHVCGPVEYIVGAAHSLQLFDPPPSTLLLAEWAKRLGMELFYPPNVGGWTGGRAWLTTRTILARANFAAALAAGELCLLIAPPDFAGLLKENANPADLAQALAFFNDLLSGGRLDAPRLAEISAQVKSIDTKSEQLRGAVALLLGGPEMQLC